MIKLIFLTTITLLAINSQLLSNDYVGLISGEVKDAETKRALSGAVIKISGTQLGSYSKKDGTFTMNKIPIGRYEVSISMVGYEDLILSDVQVVTKRTYFITAEMTMKAFQSKEVLVVPKNIQRSQDISLVSEATIENKELRMTPGTPDIFRRMSYVAGVARSGEESSALIVRGGEPEENLTMIENIEILSPFHFSSISGELVGSLSILEPKLVDNVSISTGGFSSVYGDKLSSVTNIELIRPEKNRINGDISLDLSGISTFFSGPMTDKASWIIAARRGILDWMLEMMEENFKPVTSDFHFKFLYEPSPEHKLWLYSMYASDKMIGSHGDNSDINKEIYSNILKEQSAIGLNWQWLFSENGYLLTTPYFNANDWTLVHGPDYNQDKNSQGNDETVMGFKSKMFYKFNDAHRLELGFDSKILDAEYYERSDTDTLHDGVIVDPINLLFSPDNSFKFAAFAQYHYKPIDRVDLSAGLRYDYFDFLEEQTINPRVSAKIYPMDDLIISLAWGMYSQFPQYYRIFSAYENMELVPAQSEHYIVGLNYFFEETQLKLETYYKDLSDLPIPNNDTSNVYKNSGIGQSYGVEFTWNQRFLENIYIMMNYTYSKSERKERPDEAYIDFRYDRTHTVNLMATYKLGDWWEFGISAAYSSGFPYTPFDLTTRREIDGVWYCDLAEKNSARYPDYFRIDLRAERRFVFMEWNFRVFFELWNLTDHENIFEYNYSEGYSKKESEVLFPFMPIIGLAVEF